ncbi:MAG TPA: amino acid permease [Terriglobales bacterium]|nr:amino acid permease [Terriglobales bacterium]
MESTRAQLDAKEQPVPQPRPGLVRGMSLLDSALLIIGGTIGSAIFLTPSDVATAVPAPLLYLGVWAAGGVVSLMAAFAFGELGAMFPEAGGQYVYLREAYGDFAAFLYGWMMFVAGSSGGVAAIAVAFAEYFGRVATPLAAEKVIMAAPGVTVHDWRLAGSVWHLTRGDVVAIAAILLLTAINVRGLRPAVVLQNVATWIKYLALAAFIVFGLTLGRGSWGHFSSAGIRESFAHGMYPLMTAVGVAFIAVFWCYEGWVYIAWTAGEVRNPERNIPRSLVLGLVAVIVVYLAVNAVYMYALPVPGIAQQPAVAQAAAEVLFSPAVAFWLSALIAISCFGATSSNVLAGARVSYAMGRDGLFFKHMGDVHPRFRTPAFALIAQAIWASLIALSGTYEQLFTYTVFAMILSYVACVAALFVFRKRRPDLPRPYRCFGYPWLPIAYEILIGGWVVNTIIHRPRETLANLGLLAVGVPFYLYWHRRTHAAH